MLRPDQTVSPEKGATQEPKAAPANSPALPDPTPRRSAGVNLPAIPDGGGPLRLAPPAPGNIFALPTPDIPAISQPLLPPPLVPAAPFGQHPRSRFNGLRLLPLESFFWGNAGPVLRPRVRGDHALLWVTEGRLRLGLPRNDRAFGPGQLWFLPPGTAFSAMPLADARGYALLVPPALAKNRLPFQVISALVKPADTSGLAAALSGLSNEAGASGPQAEAAIALHLELLAIHLGRIAAVPQGRARMTADLYPQATDRALVERYIELCAREMGCGRTLSELAQVLGAAVGHLDAACRRLRGKTALALLYDQRHAAAVRLLLETNMPVAQIAADLGYTSLSHFIRAFARATGRSPESFRNPDPEE